MKRNNVLHGYINLSLAMSSWKQTCSTNIMKEILIQIENKELKNGQLLFISSKPLTYLVKITVTSTILSFCK